MGSSIIPSAYAGETRTASVNFQYKARLFEMIFSHKKELLSLYNAINESHYDDPELLEINTLENAIYMSMHNDISFIIDARLYLYEHQSTLNPNLPYRFLEYVSDLYSKLTKDANIYGKSRISLPTPRFLIFYNGTESAAESLEMKLSDLYTVDDGEPMLELKAVMLNINRGCNRKLMNACRTLADYSEYTARVRAYAADMAVVEAVEKAVTECIREGILSDFLRQYRAEAIKISIYEYDEEKHMRMEREESYASGRASGLEEGHMAGLKDGESRMAGLISILLSEGRIEDLKRASDDTQFRDQLFKEFKL